MKKIQTSILWCKAKMQYLLTLKVNRLLPFAVAEQYFYRAE